MTKITSNTTTTPTTTPSLPTEATAPITSSCPETTPQTTPKDTWETDKNEKTDGFFSKLGQKIDSALDDAKTTVQDAGKTVKQAMEDAQSTVQNTRETIKQIASDGIENVQKNVNDTIDTLQSLDAETVKDIIVQDVKSTGQNIVETVKDVAEVASEAIEKQQEIKNKQNQAIEKAVQDFVSYAPDIIQEVKQTTQSIIEKTDKILEHYTPQVIQETRETIERNQLGFLDSINEIATATPQAIAELKLTVSATVGQVKEKLITELQISASEVIAKHADTIRTAIDRPTFKEKLFIDLKANTPERAHAMLDIVSLVSGGVPGIIQTQLQAMARSTAHALVDAAVTINDDPDGLRASKNTFATVLAMNINEEVFIEKNTSLSVHAEVGGGLNSGTSMVAKRDKDNPTDFLIQVSSDNTIFAGAGAEAAKKGLKLDFGRKNIESLTFRFDSNNPNDMKLMNTLIYAHKNGSAHETMLDALPKHLDEKSGSIGAVLSGGIDVGILSLSGEITGLATLSTKRTDEGMETTLSADLGQINKVGTPRLQLPDNLGLLDQTLAPQGEETPIAIYNAVMGNSSSFGADTSVEANVKVGLTFTENSRSIDDLKSIFIEVSGEVALSSNSASATARTEIRNPAELARHLKMSNQDLVRDLKNGSLTMENIADRLASEGAELGNFIKVTITTKTAHENAFVLDTGVLSHKAGTRSFTEREFSIFPPENSFSTTPQHPQQNDAAEANLRLLDRAFHA